MERRTFIHVGGALSCLALVGCIGDNGPADGGSGETPTDQPTTAPATTQPRDSIELRDFAFDVTSISGSGTPRAGVTVDADAAVVHVTGVIQGSDGCKTAALEAIDYDREADEVTLSVVTRDRPGAGDACTQQLVFISYEAAVEFGGGLPGQVVVRHDGEESASVDVEAGADERIQSHGESAGTGIGLGSR